MDFVAGEKCSTWSDDRRHGQVSRDRKAATSGSQQQQRQQLCSHVTAAPRRPGSVLPQPDSVNERARRARNSGTRKTCGCSPNASWFFRTWRKPSETIRGASSGQDRHTRLCLIAFFAISNWLRYSIGIKKNPESLGGMFSGGAVPECGAGGLQMWRPLSSLSSLTNKSIRQKKRAYRLSIRFEHRTATTRSLHQEQFYLNEKVVEAVTLSRSDGICNYTASQAVWRTGPMMGPNDYGHWLGVPRWVEIRCHLWVFIKRKTDIRPTSRSSCTYTHTWYTHVKLSCCFLAWNSTSRAEPTMEVATLHRDCACGFSSADHDVAQPCVLPVC